MTNLMRELDLQMAIKTVRYVDALEKESPEDLRNVDLIFREQARERIARMTAAWFEVQP